MNHNSAVSELTVTLDRFSAMNIKQSVIGLGLVALTLGAAVMPAIAQQTDAPTTMPGKQGKWGQGKQRGDRWQKMAERLNLTADQRSQIEAIQAQAKAEMKALLPQNAQPGDMKNLPEATKQQLKAIREATQTKIKAVLTPEQLQMMEAAKANRQNRAGRNRGGQPQQQPNQ